MFKPSNTVFVGTTPELEMALYTLCVVMKEGDCSVSLGGTKFIIRASAFIRGKDTKMIDTAYPKL